MTDHALQLLVEKVSIVYFQVPFLHNAYFHARLSTTGGRYLVKSLIKNRMNNLELMNYMGSSYMSYVTITFIYKGRAINIVMQISVHF